MMYLTASRGQARDDRCTSMELWGVTTWDTVLGQF